MNEYRSRPTVPNPFGELDPPYVGDLDAVLARGRQERAVGSEPVIEYRSPGATWAAYHPAVTCNDLRRIGLAREVTQTVFTREGKTKSETRWKITREGQQLVTDAATADPLTFNLTDHGGRP